jgi:dihydroorotate dehydrogenase electron transfer subunit
LEVELEQRRPDIIYACGPMDMLKCVIGIAENHSIPCEISVETEMACGIGVCLGCAVENSHTSGRYLHACLDGPVFNAGAIKL